MSSERMKLLEARLTHKLQQLAELRGRFLEQEKTIQSQIASVANELGLLKQGQLVFESEGSDEFQN